MNDQQDNIFDANMAQLLRKASGPPALDESRKREMLKQLEKQLGNVDGQEDAKSARRYARASEEPTGRSPWASKRTRTGRLVMKIFAGAAGLAAAAVVLVSVMGGGSGAGTGGAGSGAITRDGVVKLEDGTRLYPRSGAKYKIAGPRHVKLESGQVLLRVAKSDKPFSVETPTGKAAAKGTAFTISAETDGTFVAVGQGRVELTNPGGAVEVRAGQQAFAPAGGPPKRSAAQRFTHLVNWARENLAGGGLVENEKHASGELVAVDPWGQNVRLELRKYVIDVVIEDGIARTTVDQTFFNQREWQMEGTFYFPLPPDASLSRLAMYVSDQKDSAELNEGGMVERDYGRFVYESIVYTRRDPALLEMMEGNVFKMRVFPLLGRREKRIILSYTQTLPELYRSLRYWYPMENSQDKAGQLSIRVRVIGGAEKLEALSSTHGVSTRTEKGDLVIEHEAKNVPPNQDFLLSLRPVKDGEDAALLRTHKQDGMQYYFARWRPQIAGTVEPRPRQWIILNDVSASRSAIDVKAQAFIVERLLAEADDWDTFAIVNMDTRAKPWRKELASVRDGAAVSAAAAFAAVKERMGATNMAAGLAAAGEIARAAKAENAHVLYLGDGVATDGMTRVSDLVTLLPGGSTFIGIGVGKKVDGRFFQAAADASGGIFATINPDEDVQWRVLDMVSALNTPRLVNVSVAFVDGSGKPAAVDAHPSTGTLCDGEALTVLGRSGADETPRKLVLSGTMGGKRFVEEVDLNAARPGAEYIPRLWATARVNALLKENAELYKPEIVELSKQFYVVTPYTSLIVLENKADYERWKVEQGRKDHWQMYDAPKKVEDKVEPLPESERRNWWGEIPKAAMKGTPGHPGTIEEIVESVQFRVYMPLYGCYPGQRQRMERYRLQALLSGRLMAGGGYGEVSLPMAVKCNEQSAPSAMTMDPMSGVIDRLVDAPAEVGKFKATSGKRAQFGILGEAAYRQAIDGSWDYRGFSGYFELDDGRAVLGPIMVGDMALSLGGVGSVDGLPGKDEISLPTIVDGESNARSWRMLNEEVGWDRELPHERNWKSLPKWPALSIGGQGGYRSGMGFDGLDEASLRQFGRAHAQRWMSDRERIRQYNRRYSGWGYGYGDWDEMNMRRSGSVDVSGVLAPMLMLADTAPDVAASIALPASTPMPAMPPAKMPARMFLSNGKKQAQQLMASPLMDSFSQVTGAVPGTLATLAADRLLPLRAKLAGEKASENRDKALAAIDDMLKKLPEAAATCETTGVFWGYQGWQSVPQVWDYQPPAVQAWPGSMTLRDATQYAPGLQSTWGDVQAVILDAFGDKPAGKVDDKAAERIAAARSAVPVMLVKYTDANGNALFTFHAAADKFSWTSTSEMYLREDVVCDGKAIYHSYPEIALASRREQLAWRLPALRRLTPHVLPPAEELARAWDVTLMETSASSTTVRLTPIARNSKLQGAPGEAPKDAPKMPAVEVLVTFDGKAFLQRQEWRVDGKVKLACAFTYDGAKVKVAWKGWAKDGKEKELGQANYVCQVVDAVGDLFAPPGADVVVIDMPLRRTEHYEALLKEAGADAAKRAERIALGRQLAASALQDGWQQPWGQVRKTYEALVAVHNELAAAKLPAAAGDATLLACAGHSPKVLAGATGKAAKELPVHEYMLTAVHGSNVPMSRIAQDNKGTFAGHLATYSMIYSGGNERPGQIRKMMAEYPLSPLLYAAVQMAGNDDTMWLELAKMPRWRSAALYTAAQRSATAAVGEAFEAYHKQMLKYGWSVPISRGAATALQQAPGRWQRVIEASRKAAVDANDVGGLLRLAELAPVSGPEGKAFSDSCIAAAEKLAGDRLPQTWKLALVQSLWAMNKPAEAWAKQQEIMATLKEKSLPVSPAMLALSARLAQAAGQHEQAVELELRAIEAEKPYMPERINVYLFRQRYQWLWNELSQRVSQLAAQAKAPADAAAGRSLDEALAQVKGVWDEWLKVDSSNSMNLYQQLATLYRSAGRNEEAWQVVSSIIDEKPRDGSSYANVGNWYSSNNDRDTALKFLSAAYDVEPTNGDWIWQRAEMLKQMGRKKDAKAAYQEIVGKKWQPRFEHYVQRAREAMKGL